jgi:hypothetical protein
MAFDICVSVPYHLGYSRPTSVESPLYQPAFRALFILQSLPFAAGWVGVPRSMKEYVSRRLLYIGHILGIRQAFFLYNLVSSVLDGETLETMKNAGQGKAGHANDITDARGNSGWRSKWVTWLISQPITLPRHPTLD